MTALRYDLNQRDINRTDRPGDILLWSGPVAEQNSEPAEGPALQPDFGAASNKGAAPPVRQVTAGKTPAVLEADPQNSGRIDLAPLLAKARRGDPAAFDKLMHYLSPHVLVLLRRAGAAAEDAEDALSKTMIIIHRLLLQKRFEDMHTGGFIAYFRKVALHEWLHRPEARRAMQTVPLTICDHETGVSIELEIADRSEPISERIANLSLYDFLVRQLDEVFVAGRKGPERYRGELEKLAFVYFYQDGMTQNEIYEIVSVVGVNFTGMPPVTRADLNNWLSMGRSLKALLKHLAERHTEILGMLIEMHIACLGLAVDVANSLRYVFCERRSLEWIASKRGRDVAEIRREVSVGKKQLIERLARTIKGQLKASRAA